MIDVLIAGGGVAGCAAAIGLARRGLSVAILDRKRDRSEPLRETLAPSIRPVLAALGVWDRFVSDVHAPCYGMYSVWGKPELYSNDFIFHPHGPGWRLNRTRFDQMLARRGVVVENRACFSCCLANGFEPPDAVRPPRRS